MRKTNTSIRRLKFVKGIAVFLVIQFVLLGVSYYIYLSLEPENENNLKSATITIDEIEYQVYPYTGYILNIVADSVKYRFSKSVYPRAECSTYELYKTLKKGDTISIIYVDEISQKPGLVGTANSILDAKIGTTQLRSINVHNEELARRQTGVIVLFVVIEIVWCALLAFYCAFNRDILVRKKRK